MSIEAHKNEAPKQVCCKVITVSDTRTIETDKSGKFKIEALESNGHKVTNYEIVSDDQIHIRSSILGGCEDKNVDVILLNGGTGIAKRDVTIETIKNLIEKEVVGFGELFRMLSYTEDIGSAAILSRAISGVCMNTAIFSTPGSSGAVKLAMTKLILPEITHVIREIRKDL